MSFGLASSHWIVLGDFNEILHPNETSNPSIIKISRGMHLFGECLGDIVLFDLPSTGPGFTWTNKHPTDPMGTKIDRCLVNCLWLLICLGSHSFFKPPDFSDYTPSLVKLHTDPPRLARGLSGFIIFSPRTNTLCRRSRKLGCYQVFLPLL